MVLRLSCQMMQGFFLGGGGGEGKGEALGFLCCSNAKNFIYLFIFWMGMLRN